jgi:hypothetical protein
MKRALWVMTLALWMLAPTAHAQTLADAESALTAGDAAQAMSIARALIDEGIRVGAELAPLYRVLGLAAGAAGQEDAAREAFTRWLALDPEGHLDRTLSDDVRSPFLEARGFWANQPTRLGATATLRDGGGGIEVALVDPASMVARLRVRLRTAGGAWSDVVRPPAALVTIDVAGLPPGGGLDYVITFLDESGNRIWTRGSDDAPLHLGDTGPAIADVADPGPAPVHEAPADATGFHVGAVVAAVIAVGAIVGAAVLHADRERLAGIYNGDGTGCTGTGTTRGDLCGPQRSAISSDEVGAITLYAVGGAAAITAIVLAAIAPSGASDAHAAFACGAGPGTMGLSCGGTF